MTNIKGSKSCLLIMQKSFYSFEKIITEALNLKGYTVEVANDEYPEGFLGKVMGKLQFPLIFFLTAHTIKKKYLINKSYDLAIIIKGRGISKNLILEMKKSTSTIVGYNWDSFKYNRSPLKWFHLLTKFYTFDYSDAKRFSLPHLELFSAQPISTDKKQIEYDISALVRNYSGRLKYIDRILKVLKPSKPFIYIYEQNLFDFINNFFKSPLLYCKYLKYIHFKPQTRQDYIKTIDLSEFTIDYAHHAQNGITMRCYEALSMRTKIISNNPLMAQSSYFNQSNYVLFLLSDPEEQLLSSYKACKNLDFLFESRDILRFLDELIA